ncbi:MULTISPECIES: antibiotic biosynthesis monooxygenase family protein [unclassified Sphingomonas]|uniref:antibiotic biosynthesis monooxygenase family protein n=1 Tax=unclassified Sphingomonas TaxID=196159 RepID=UPI000B2AEC43|nr:MULTISPECIES: antibiotic biosynthesis monooxygenase [unclassified Sphingomonas]
MVYLSMQRVRFSSPDGYEKFKVLFADVGNHLTKIPGFLHLTWWTHPNDPSWHNEVSFWSSFETLKAWHLNPYHKHSKEWAVRSGAIMEDIITNFELKNTRLIRVCPTCGTASDKSYELRQEQAVLKQPCGVCGFNFPVMPDTENSFALFRDEILATG